MVGSKLGHYRILQRIGEGGVGLVYLAEDLRLERKVALKVLAQAAPRPDQIARFEREAKAVAALDHPNILAIHEFGYAEGTPYVAMELLEGRTLRQALEHGPLTLRIAIGYAIDIARGLAAAHDKGIWHRDLKPENVFVTRDGRVKILDFGLASAKGSAPETMLAAGATMTNDRLTSPGLVLGTVGYMAPEQVRGQHVDGRADIFACGAVAFEMLAGRRAFDAPTSIEALHAILNTAVDRTLLVQVGVPSSVMEIVERCLEKDRERRFPSAAALLAALQSVDQSREIQPSPGPAERRLDSWKEIAAYLGRGVRTVQRWEREGQLPVHRLDHAKGGSVFADRRELARWRDRRQRMPEVPPPASTPIPPAVPVPSSSQARSLPRLERLTSTSVVTLSPSLSADARLLVYLSSGGDPVAAPQVWLQPIGGTAMRLTADQRECADPTLSPDNTRVLFTARGDTNLNVYEVPAFGGLPRLLKANAKWARMSSDGRWLAWVLLDQHHPLSLEKSDGTAERVLAPSLQDVSFVVWSPDSQQVLVRAHPDARFELDYWIVPIDGGPPQNSGIIERFRAQGTVLDSPPAWIGDSIICQVGCRDGVILFRQRLAPHTLEMRGDPEPLTRGTEWAGYPSAAAGRLAFINARADMNLWSLAIEAGSGRGCGVPRRLTRGPGIQGHLQLAADGRTLAYFSTRSGMPGIVLRDLGTGTETLVNADPPHLPKATPSLSLDGLQLAYSTVVPGGRALRPLFLYDLPDGPSRQVLADCGGRPRQWLDGRSILLETFGTRLGSLVVVDVTTGRLRPLLAASERSVANPRISPDLRWIAFDAAPPGASPGVFVAPLDGTEVVFEAAWAPIAADASHPFWSADGTLLYYLPVTPTRELRSLVAARQLDRSSGRPIADAFTAATLGEALVATVIPGTTPVATKDAIVFPLGDLSGDIWMTEI